MDFWSNIFLLHEQHIWTLFRGHYSFPPVSETSKSFITLMDRLILKNLSRLSELAITRTQCIWILGCLSLAISRYVLNSVSTLKTKNVLEMSTFLWFDMFFRNLVARVIFYVIREPPGLMVVVCPVFTFQPIFNGVESEECKEIYHQWYKSTNEII